MKSGTSLSILLMAAVGFCAPAPAWPQQHAAAAGTHTFSSGLGFDFTYPAAWSVNIVGPVLPASQMALDQQSESDPYRRSIECSQNIFSARLGEPRSTFLAGVITTECMGKKPDLDAFTRRTITTLSRRYQLNQVQSAAFSVQGQTFWVMRTTGTDRQNGAGTETIEYLATLLPQGLVYWSAHAMNQQAQSGFEQAHLHLANGVETELIPSGAFDAKTSPQQAFTNLGSITSSGSLIKENTKASHLFDMGAGFSYEVPRNFMILDTDQWEASVREQLSGESGAGQQAPSHRCSRPMLVAEPEDNSKLVVVTDYQQECLLFASKAENLSLFLANDTVNLTKIYKLRNPEYGAFDVGAHSFAVMSTAAALKKRPWESDRFLVLLLTTTPSGIAEYFLMGRTRADLDELMATRLKFDDGAESALVPAISFAAKPQPAHPAAAAPESAPSQSITPEAPGSHLFDSGLGFSIELPQDLAMVGGKQFEDTIRAMARQQMKTGQEAKSIDCAQPLLTAERLDESRILSLVAFPRSCIGNIVTGKNLAEVGRYGAGELAKRYALITPEYGAFFSGAHTFWVMRSVMTPRPPENPNGQIAVLVTATPEAVIECLLLGKTKADLDALMAIRLKFDDGAETNLTPASAFAAKP